MGNAATPKRRTVVSGHRSISVVDARATAAKAMAELKHLAKPTIRAGMSRFGIPSEKALGISVGTLQKVARKMGRSQEVAELLWKTDVYEARLLAAFVGEPEKLTVASMDRWCRGFDNWAVVDTVCFKLFDRSLRAWSRVRPWARQHGEFQRRAGFVLLACLAAHADPDDAALLRHLPLIEWGATDERNFVKKGVSWALRMFGRKSPAVRRAALATARKLAGSESAAARWVGRDALRDLK
jgi:3-methyladenine DNA glycosylase AlkD